MEASNRCYCRSWPAIAIRPASVPHLELDRVSETITTLALRYARHQRIAMPRQEQVRSNGGFIAAIVCSLIAMGGAGALALSRLPTIPSPLSGGATNTSFDSRDIKQAGRIVGLGLGAKMISDEEVE